MKPDPRHPASDGERHEIPDLVEQTREEASSKNVEPQDRAQLDYVDQDIPVTTDDVKK